MIDVAPPEQSYASAMPASPLRVTRATFPLLALLVTATFPACTETHPSATNSAEAARRMAGAEQQMRTSDQQPRQNRDFKKLVYPQQQDTSDAQP